MISGQVTAPGTSTSLSGVTMTLSGTGSASTTSDPSGDFSFTGLANGGNYTVTPTLSGYTFTPARRTFSCLNGSQPAGFSGTATATNRR